MKGGLGPWLVEVGGRMLDGWGYLGFLGPVWSKGMYVR